MIQRKLMPGYACLSIDVSSFDNCIREAFFDGELDVFSTLYPTLDRECFELARVFSFTDEHNPGPPTRELPRARKSGDLHTGSGNCAVMHFYCHRLRQRHADLTFYCDGDDTLIFCRAG